MSFYDSRYQTQVPQDTSRTGLNPMAPPQQTASRTALPTQQRTALPPAPPPPPPNIWGTQPQPRATAGSNVFAPPPGFNIGEGSQNQALNQQVYGSNYFPRNLPNYQGIGPEEFANLDPTQQGGYRQALYQQNRLNQFLGPQPGEGQRFSYNQVQDFTQNPGYQNQLRESERAIQRNLLHTGRSDSTGAQNVFARNARNLAGDFEQQAYQRALGEEGTNYARDFAENERQYGREWAAQKFLTELGIQQNDTRWKQIYDLMLAGATPGVQ